jgi:plastocyanin
MRSAAMVQGSDFPDGARQSLITNFAFEGNLEVEIGQSVYFNNSDSVPHTVSAGTSDAPDLDSFDSGLLAPGDNWELGTSEPGTYSYFCALHPDMTATIIVS